MILIVKNATIKRSGSDLIVSWDNTVKHISTLDLEMLIVVGNNVNLSSSVINFLSSLNIPVLIHGKKVDTILVTPFVNTISEVRRKFYTLDEGSQILLAKRFIEGKIKGMLNVARYFSYIDKLEVKNIEIRLRVNDKKSLILEEAELSKEAWEELRKFMPKTFQGRKPRGDDPINRAIDYAYSIIYTLSTHAVIAAGLDPYAGLLHSNHPGRPSLVYDFSEMFKPVAIHTVIAVSRRSNLSLDNEGYLKKDGLEHITKHLYSILHKRRGKRSIRGEFYRKANELKKFVLEATDFQPFIYRPLA
ncbi:MAG: CRISPR-associated endonuclease Cas1 [Sulfolobaceae archaeon]